MKTLRESVPCEFFAEYRDTRAFKLLDCEVAEEISMTDMTKWRRWPGPEKNVMCWWQLADGRAVGWNENPARGWSFPVHGRKHK